MPASWPNSEEDGWLAKQLEGYSRLAILGEDPHSIVAKNRVELRDLLQPYDFSRGDAGDRFRPTRFVEPDNLPASHWDWRHLSGKDIWTGRLSEMELRQRVFDQWDLLIPLLGGIITAGSTILARM